MLKQKCKWNNLKCYRIPSEFSVAQRAFLREIYSEIVGSEDGSISSTDGLNLSRTLGVKLAMGDADAFLKDLYKRKWLYTKVCFIDWNLVFSD